MAELIKDLGFIRGLRGRDGYVILEHPDLAIEFLVPEKGKGTDKPVKLPELGLNAQALRFLELLAQDTIDLKIEGVSLILPHPANFGLHKLIIASRRRLKDKSNKDREAGLNILRTLTAKKEENLIRKVFDSIPSKWQKTILNELQDADERHLIEILKQ